MARRIGWAFGASIAVTGVTSACTTSVPGQAIRASGEADHAPTTARDLLLQDGGQTPSGPATEATLGANYFTAAKPAECSAAILFKNSPLPPAGSTDHAEAAFILAGVATYAESVDIYTKPLNTVDVVSSALQAVTACHGDAYGISRSGQFGPMTLTISARSSDGVLVWTMARQGWTCDYGLAVVPTITLRLSTCAAEPGFPMAEWAEKRRSQIDSRA